MRNVAPGSASPTSFRSLVLPREHGSWSLALEPVALGLLVAPSRGGAWLALAVIAGFFTRRPLKLAVTLPRSDPRRRATIGWMLLFATTALAGLLLSTAPSLWRNTPHPTWTALWPLLLATPFGAAFLWFDLRGEMREAEAEIAGSAAFALVPAAFATLAGWSAAPALSLAGLMLARSVPTVLTVRAYLRLAKGKPATALPALACAGGALIAVVALATRGLVPGTAAALALLLVARTAWLLSPRAPTWSARRAGITEAILGAVFVAALALGYGAR